MPVSDTESDAKVPALEKISSNLGTARGEHVSYTHEILGRRLAITDIEWDVDREIPHLRRFAFALTGNWADADDLVQDALERAWRKRHTWKRRGTLRAWLFRIVYTVFLNKRRSERNALKLATLQDDTIPAIALPETPPQEARVHVNDMLRGLVRLPPEQRAPIVLVALENVTYDEAAQMLGVPVGTLRSRLFRGREALKDFMDELDEKRPRLRRVK
jgi:RNA polymerase sigma-70 factor (ECF subfamily)